MKNFLLIILVLCIYNNVSVAQNTAVVVPFFGDAPKPGIAVAPIYCFMGIGPGFQRDLLCNRSDTRDDALPVPSGHFLFITDIVTNRNTLATSGLASVTIGRKISGTFPSSPRFSYTYSPVEQSQYNFSTPYLVFRENEEIRVSNDSSGIAVNIYVSGYLIEADSFGE